MQGIPELPPDAAVVQLRPGTPVFAQGDDCSRFVIVTAGSIRVFARSPGGKEVTLYRVTPGEICVLTTSCLLGRSRYPADGITEAATTATILSRQEFDTLFADSAPFREFVLQNFGARLADLVGRIETIVLDPIEHRLLVYLDNRADPDGVVTTTQQAIADDVGSAREVVSRHLQQLQRDGLIVIERGRLRIADRAALRDRLGIPQARQ